MTFPVLFRMGLLEGEIAALQLEILGPGMALLGVLDTDFTGTPGPEHRPGFVIWRTEAIDLRFAVEEEGDYSVQIYTDGRLN